MNNLIINGIWKTTEDKEKNCTLEFKKEDDLLICLNGVTGHESWYISSLRISTDKDFYVCAGGMGYPSLRVVKEDIPKFKKFVFNDQLRYVENYISILRDIQDPEELSTDLVMFMYRHRDYIQEDIEYLSNREKKYINMLDKVMYNIIKNDLAFDFHEFGEEYDMDKHWWYFISKGKNDD